MSGQRHSPVVLHPGETRYPLYRRLGRPQGRSGGVRKISPTPGFDPRAVQPVASRYTDWAIAAHSLYTYTHSLYVCRPVRSVLNLFAVQRICIFSRLPKLAILFSRIQMKLVMQSILQFLFLRVDCLNFYLVFQNKILLARVSVGLSVTTERVQRSETEVNCSDLLSKGPCNRSRLTTVSNETRLPRVHHRVMVS